MDVIDVTAFHEAIKNNNSFVITSHIDPDGDSIGSILALTLALLKKGKKAVPVVNDDIPKKYEFLPGSNLITKGISDNYDALVAVDSSDIERLGFRKELDKYTNVVINIDHHKSNTRFGNLNIVDSNASSAGEIIYKLLNGKTEIDYDIALNLFTSIVTDTGSMRYSNTTSLTLRILADLVDKGVKPNYVSRQVFEKRSIGSINLLKLALDTLELSADNKVASIYITKEMLEITGALEEDIDGIINYAREIEGVEVAVLFREKEESLTKVGFRSNEWIDVSKIAEKFNGGGHLRAAGCIVEIPLEKARKIVLNTVGMYIMEGFSGRCN